MGSISAGGWSPENFLGGILHACNGAGRLLGNRTGIRLRRRKGKSMSKSRPTEGSNDSEAPEPQRNKPNKKDYFADLRGMTPLWWETMRLMLYGPRGKDESPPPPTPDGTAEDSSGRESAAPIAHQDRRTPKQKLFFSLKDEHLPLFPEEDEQ